MTTSRKPIRDDIPTDIAWQTGRVLALHELNRMIRPP